MAYPYEQANSYDFATGKQNTETKNTYLYLGTTGAQQVKSGSGYIDLISGTPGTGAINVYDLAAGTTASLANQIGTFPAGSALASGNVPFTTFFHAQYNNGLYLNVVSTATVAQATLSYS